MFSSALSYVNKIPPPFFFLSLHIHRPVHNDILYNKIKSNFNACLCSYKIASIKLGTLAQLVYDVLYNDPQLCFFKVLIKPSANSHFLNNKQL
jgi:hypothetical protein